MEKEYTPHKFEPSRGAEYSDILRVRCGLYPCYPQFNPAAADIYTNLLNDFGHEWATSHNQKALLNLFERFVESCSGNGRKDIPEHLKIHVVDVAWTIFKCAWVNHKEYLPEKSHKE